MSEETVLKSSIFGGYKKQDVMQYVDSVLNQNEKRERKLADQVEQLLRENKKMKAQLTAENNIHTKMKLENQDVKAIQTNDSVPIPFPTSLTQRMENREKPSVRELMDLPEGTYFVSKSQGVVSIPDPEPIYRTKNKEAEYSKIAVTEEKISNPVNEVAFYEEATAVNEKDIWKSFERFAEPQDEMIAMKVTALQAEVEHLKKLLEQEKHENILLATKLDYSKELFMQLYKANNK
jgi:regulator of replication initiation timing